ncbi:hypothetical protein DH2020_017411 [Rehmannia glutinosa]|uniref:Dof zinc finger protein n=1 Tax=Rehmannia glutinosa TaxID=99300 RepID=A0ABR0WRF0_REHGL
MGLSTKQFSGELDWGKTTLQPGAPELSKPPSIKRQHQQSEPLNCPRCNSTNTKFCYYNNYNKSQPRHFCKSCKRHWTKGGTLRNVPVGGGRKNKRPKISNAAGDCANTININAGLNLSAELPNENTEIFQLSNLSNFDMNASLIPISNYQSLNGFDNYTGNILDSIEESSSVPWPGPNTSGCLDQLPNYWNWNEIDVFLTSSDHLNISWDDEAEIKP